MVAQVVDLTNLSADQGFIIQGDIAGDTAGFSVSDAGDVNGDGIADLIISATGGDDGGGSAGEAYVIFGRSTGFGSAVGGRQVIDLTSLSASDGFIIQGDTENDQAGRSVSGAGDINGDGIDDLIVGAAFGDDGGSDAGEAYVIFGRSNGFGSAVGGRQVIDLTNLSGNDGFIIQGNEASDRTGFSVSSAGDVNGDGIDDLLVGAPYGDGGGPGAGEAYVIFGRSNGFGSAVGGRQVLDLTTLSASDGFVIQGDTTNDQAGRSVSSAGDVNGDGIDDLIIGARMGDDGGDGAGEAYVIFGRTTGFGSPLGGRHVIDLTILSAVDGFIIQGDTAGDHTGNSVSSAGDVNGDGFDDLLVGATYGDDGGSSAGEAYVIFGRSTGFGSAVSGRQIIDLTSLSASDGFIIQGGAAGDAAGFSVSNAGDVNGDGIDDLIVGARLGDDGGNGAGEAYVIFGRSSGFGSAVGGRQVMNLHALSATDALIIQGDEAGDSAGFSVSGAGDVNGDGIDDLIVGATGGDDGGSNAGEAYVIFGSSNIVPITGTAASETLTGTVDADVINGLDGDDTLRGESGNDRLNGGEGSDRLFGGTGADIMNGEGGNDRIVVDHAGDTANGGSGIDTVQFVAAGLTYTLEGDVEIVSNHSGDALTLTMNALGNTYGGGAGIDTVLLGSGGDTAYGRAGNDSFAGEGGNDYLFGEAGSDILNGGADNDFLYGGADTDNLLGGSGADTLYGQDGDDLINGGAGVDQLFGGSGTDFFVFFDSDSSNTLATADRIRDFSQAQGDRIQLDGIDAVAGGDNDAFSFIGTAAFSNVAGQLRVEVVGGETRVSGDTNGDGVADFLIRLDGVHMLSAGDFVF